MPPSIPRKRSSPAPLAPPLSNKRAAPATAGGKKNNSQKQKQKPSLFDTLDASKPGATAEEAQSFLANLNGADSDSDSNLSDIDSDDFEDVMQAPPPKRRKVVDDGAEEDEGGEDSDEMDFEDVDLTHQAQQVTANAIAHDDDSIGDITISLNDDGTVAAEAGTAGNKNVKKGPSKRDRQIRIRTHMMHVQSLVFHNAVRNSWLNDKEVQGALVNGLSNGVKKEVQRWRVDMGYEKPPEDPKKRRKGKRRSEKDKEKEKRDGRDWGIDADRLETGAINMSRGDPMMRLLKVLAAYWKKRFTITAPGIRKQGYMPLRRLADDIKHWDKNKSDAEEHGERISSVEHFRKLAKECRGSRDVGAQLFTALIRGIGIEARMVASLQPVGFGWSKAEDAAARKPGSSKTADVKSTPDVTDAKSTITISDDENDSIREVQVKANTTFPNKILKPQKPIRKTTRGIRPATTTQSDSSSLSDAPSSSDDDDASIVDITPSQPPYRDPRKLKKYDRDLAFPHYWTEVLSPATSTYIPVDSVVLSTVASTPDLLSTFEPRGRAADYAKQVIAYTLAYNPDSTAKDVTVRYLKRHQLPGRTKGFRMPVEKVPIYNKKGKVLRYEEQDWFSTVILPFLRPKNKISEAEQKEDETDLLVFKPAASGEGKQKVGEESLQWYKQSAEFVLERHLRREEALLPSAEQVRTFTSGKGDKQITEPVYARKDVVVCKTVESWHKEGRQILPGAQPMKMVPVRAVTLIRKREMEEVQRETGEKLKQGLYSRAQTEWIIPPPIGEDRKIPKNAFGNMDVYVPSMVPKGAVHVRLKGCAKLCRKMDIEHAEACVGFEFGKQRAVPVLFGVVVAQENEGAVRDAWRIEQELQRRKEDVKREALVLHLWRKFTMGLRIVERMKSEYRDNGVGKDEVNPFVNRERQEGKSTYGGDDEDETMNDYNENENENDTGYEHDDGTGGGGFFLPGEEEALLAGPAPKIEANVEHEMDVDLASHSYDDSGGGGFILDEEDDDDEEEQTKPDAPKATTFKAKPMSLQAAHGNLPSQTNGLHNNDDEVNASETDKTDEEDEPIKPTPRPQRSAPAAAASITKVKKPATRSTPAARKAKPKATVKTKAIAPAKKATKMISTPSESENSSDLTDIESASASPYEAMLARKHASEKKSITSKPRRKRAASPAVIITPRISRLGSMKSHYFTKATRETPNLKNINAKDNNNNVNDLGSDDEDGHDLESADAAGAAAVAGRSGQPEQHHDSESRTNSSDEDRYQEKDGDTTEEDDEEKEVVIPRRTTARTRKSLV